MIVLILAGCVMAGVFIRWAVANDAYDAHLFHGHQSNCGECVDK